MAAPEQFGQHWKTTKYTPWRFYYLDYEALQREMATAQESRTMSCRLQDEWIKVGCPNNMYMAVNSFGLQ